MDNNHYSDPQTGSTVFDLPCACGSGEPAGACCKSNEPCPCGSGKKAGECCYASEMDDDDEQ